jgi:AcrR family transcriptional regulator
MTIILSAERREDVVQAAFEAFVAHSWFEVRLEDIARRAGVSTDEVLAAFESREALFAEAVASLAQQTVSRAEVELPDGGAREQLVMLCARAWDTLRTPEFTALYRTAIALKATSPALSYAFRERFVDRWRDLLSRVIARGVARGELRPNAPAAARIISSSLLLQAVWCSDTDAAWNSGRVVQEMLDVVLDGIAVKD